MEIISESVAAIRSKTQDRLPDFLLAEYEHMCESFLRNEESGEKRAAFFVTLVGASGGILGFVFRENAPVTLDQIFLAVAVVAAVLLCLGFLTVKRLIERNIETDKIIFALRTLRRLFLTQRAAAALSNAFAPYGKPKLREVKWRSFGKGGWLQTVAFVNALLAFIVVSGAILAPSWDVAWPWQKPIALILALAVGVMVWIVQLKYAARSICKNHKELIEAEPRWLQDLWGLGDLKCGSTV